MQSRHTRGTSRWMQAVAGVCLLLTAFQARALYINSYTGNELTYNRFESGYPTAPVDNTSTAFIGAAYDWSGVGWSAVNSNQSVAMLSPQHVLYAAHYTPSTTLRFTAGDGTITSATVQSYSGALVSGQDVAVGTLKTPVSSTAQITTYALWFQGYNTTPYENKDLLVYGMGARVGKARVDSFWVESGTTMTTGTTIRKSLLMFTNTPATQGAGYCNFQVGDSGSPTFYMSPEGKLVLTGVHYAVSSTVSGQSVYYSWDSMAAGFLPEINREMAKTGWLPEIYTPVTNTWNAGSAANDSWSTGNNWQGRNPAADTMNVVGTETLVWNAAAAQFSTNQTSTRFSVTVDAAQQVTGLAFTGTGTGRFSFSGTHTLTLGEAGIRNSSTVSHTLNVPVSMRTAQRWDAGSGGLTVAGTIANNGNLLFITGSAATTLSGVISGSGGLAKDGSGTLLITASNLYTGTTFIHAGTLSAGNAAALGTGAIRVESGANLSIAAGVVFTRSATFASGATLGGKGTYSPAGGFTVVNGMHVAPGNSPGTLTVGDISFTTTSFLDLEIGGTTAGTTYDQLVSTGTMALNGTLTVSFIDGFTPSAGQEFFVLDWETLTGTFSEEILPTLGGSLSWDTSNLYTTGVLAVVPEPALMLSGSLLLLWTLRRRPRRTAPASSLHPQSPAAAMQKDAPLP